MKVCIDQDACVGNAICAELAGDVILFDGDLAYVRHGAEALRAPGASVEVPQGLEDAVLDAAEECPAGCIYIEEN